MNPSRLALAILMIVPTVLFIAAAESAADTAPAAAASQGDKPAAPAATVPSEAAAPAQPALPLRTAEPALALPGTSAADQEATASILSAIRSDPGMAGADVSVNTDSGVVTLTGVVRNREQAALASAYANRPFGVLRVDNVLSIPAQ
ncbi:MAG TPA: BON domain-containing protein [Usitatibacter sp.]|nr:BON domain-containing protein [Usitatibacter sp.]